MILLSNDTTVSTNAMNQNEWVIPDNNNKSGTINYEYNDNGQLIKSTYIASFGSSQYSKFSYDGSSGMITKQTLYWDNKKTGYIEYSYDEKGNLVEEILYNYTPSTGVAEIITTTLYEFDNKTNPYKSIGSLMIPGIETNINNITKETCRIHVQANHGTDIEQITQMSYTYNTNGYPISKNGNVKYIYGL